VGANLYVTKIDPLPFENNQEFSIWYRPPRHWYFLTQNKREENRLFFTILYILKTQCYFRHNRMNNWNKIHCELVKTENVILIIKFKISTKKNQQKICKFKWW
jgi:hypothetical protein